MGMSAMTGRKMMRQRRGNTIMSMVVLLFLVGYRAGLVYGTSPLRSTPSEEPSTPAPVRLTLSESIRMALDRSPEIRGAQQKVEAAEAQVAEAKSGFYPRTNFTNIFGLVPRARGDVFFSPDAGDIVIFSGLGPFSKGDLEIVQPLYTFGKLTNSLLAAEKGVISEQAGEEKTANAVIMQVKELYYSLLLTRHIADVLSEVKKGFEEAIKEVRKRLREKKGKVSQLDLLKLKVGLAGTTKELQEVEKNVAVTRAALQRTIGLPPTVDFDIADTRLKPEKFDLKALQDYIQLTFQHRPEWKQVQAGVESRKALLEAEKSNYYPTFFLAGGLQYAIAPNRDDQDNPFVYDEFNYLRGGFALGLRWNLNFLTTKARVRKAEAELAKVQNDLENARLGLPLEVTRAYLEVKAAQEELDAASDGRRAGRSLLVLTFTNFKLGIGEAKDLFEALAIFARTTTTYYQAVHALNLALARLSNAVGKEVTTLQY
ncbi:MAG: TolC family protein [Nitrospinota bacterium]|nr:MAG: TolC family protein [Nitrospinota bacterium]